MQLNDTYPLRFLIMHVSGYNRQYNTMQWNHFSVTETSRVQKNKNSSIIEVSVNERFFLGT